MSVAEIKQVVDRATDEERVFMAAYLQHVERATNSSHALELDQKLSEVETGKSLSLADFKKALNA